MAESIDMSEEVEMESSAEEKVEKRLVFPSLNQQSDGETEIVEHVSMSDIRDKMVAWVKRMREDPSFKVVFKADEDNADHTNALTYAMKFAEASKTISKFNVVELQHFKNNNLYDNDVTIAMATHPARKNKWLNVVYQLLPQCTRLCICFNQYNEIPHDIPQSSKIIAICANNKNGIKDLGCLNKMYWLGDYPGYYATVDDDIIYPSNYIQVLKNNLKKYNNKIIVSYHGQLFYPKNGKIDFANRKVILFHQPHKECWCHRLGMGVAMCHPSSIGISKKIYMSFDKNAGDDEITSIWAQKNNIPMLCISNQNVKIYSDDIGITNGLSLDGKSTIKRRQFMMSYKNWKLNIYASN